MTLKSNLFHEKKPWKIMYVCMYIYHSCCCWFCLLVIPKEHMKYLYPSSEPLHIENRVDIQQNTIDSAKLNLMHYTIDVTTISTYTYVSHIPSNQ